MIFCGQCGFQLAPGGSACPRCGAAVERGLVAEDPHTDDPTLASLSANQAIDAWTPQTPRNPQDTWTAPVAGAGPAQQHPLTPPQQEKLILRSDGTAYSAQNVNEATYRMDTPETSAPPGYEQQQGADYRGISYPGFAQAGGYQPVPGTEPVTRPRVRHRGRNTALLTLLIVLLLLLSAAVAYTLKLNGIIGGGGGPTPTPTLTAQQQAQQVVEQYYTDINTKNYQDAFNLWGIDPQNPNPSYTDFVNGYAHTQHDAITITKTTQLANGTVQVDLTINATEDTGNSVYQGYYIVGQQNGVWKLLKGYLNKVG